MLEVKNLRKEYKDIVAVNDISFSVQEGKIFGLLGPNGAGKTTTIRTILNIIKPSIGSISFEGKPITDEFFNIIGYLPEERGLYKKSKVIDVILYLSQLKAMLKNEALSSADYWLKRFNLLQYRNKKLEELSKGLQQLVQFICAVIHNPKLLILDEPFSGFDPINQQIIKENILEFSSSGKIIILSTHQMDTAEKLCSDILLINKGKEVLSGSLNKIKRQFGRNHVQIHFTGDGTCLNTLEEIEQLDFYSNYAEIKLRDNINPSDFLRTVANKIDITNFSVIEPTLNKIFIDAVK